MGIYIKCLKPKNIKNTGKILIKIQTNPTVPFYYYWSESSNFISWTGYCVNENNTISMGLWVLNIRDTLLKHFLEAVSPEETMILDYKNLDKKIESYFKRNDAKYNNVLEYFEEKKGNVLEYNCILTNQNGDIIKKLHSFTRDSFYTSDESKMILSKDEHFLLILLKKEAGSFEVETSLVLIDLKNDKEYLIFESIFHSLQTIMRSFSKQIWIHGLFGILKMNFKNYF
eukprot:gene1400-12020_t